MMRMMRKLKTMTVSKIGNNNDDADDFADAGEEDLKVVELWWHLDTDMSDKELPLSNIDLSLENDDSGL